jgi:hypothetical protein
MKLKSLIKNLGDQLNIPVDELESFNINNFVENSMKVVQGEIKSLRTPLKPVEFDDLKKHENENANFVDEEYISYTSEETPLQTARSTSSVKNNKPSQSAR